MQKVIKGYIRTDSGYKRRPIGVMLAKKEAGRVIIAFSKANEKAGDKYDPAVGAYIAAGRLVRAFDGEPCPMPKDEGDFPSNVPYGARGDLLRFADRARRYFRTKQIALEA